MTHLAVRRLGRHAALTRLRILATPRSDAAAFASLAPIGAKGNQTRKLLARWWHRRLSLSYVCVAVAAFAVGGVALACLVCGYLWLLRRMIASRAMAADRAAADSVAAELCSAVAEDIRVGRAAHAALVAAMDSLQGRLFDRRLPCGPSPRPCEDCVGRQRRADRWDAVRRAAAGGTDVAAALRAVPAPFRTWCERLATAWQLHDSGMPMSRVLDGLEEELSATRRSRQARLVHTAAARATATVVTCLPVLGLFIGYAMGADPAAVLLGSPVGAGCVIAAVGLHCAGWVWVARIADPERRSYHVKRQQNPVGSRAARRRIVGLTGAKREETAAQQDNRLLSPLTGWTSSVALGMAVVWFIGVSAVGLLLWSGAIAASAWYLRRLRQGSTHGRDTAWLLPLPYALSLIAAVIRAGAPAASALCLVGPAVAGRLGAGLAAVGAAMIRGADVPITWRRTFRESPHAAALLGMLGRSHRSGAALAQGLARLSQQAREEKAATDAAAAQRSAVVMIAPLMCCFLPAFVLLGVVPVVVDVLHRSLGAAV
ncbi:MAG TPA: type II secretion system F family protein [Mycobacteriales bacterium]|nr:type II secretion system F family protein [Mycobacteriales bacterium]